MTRCTRLIPSREEVTFVKKYAWESEEKARVFYRCFSNNLADDSDETFELRLLLYNSFPRLAWYFDFRSLYERDILKVARVLEFVLCHQEEISEDVLDYDGFEKLCGTADFSLAEANSVVTLLLPCVHKDSSKGTINLFSGWSARYSSGGSIERTIVVLLKTANKIIVQQSPDTFFDLYKNFIGCGFVVYNELILSALLYFPVSHSDEIVSYLHEDFDRNAFDETSGNGDKMLLAKELLKMFAPFCSQQIYVCLERKIITYISPTAKEDYERRIEFNKEKERDIAVYWSFWGDFQLELLRCLPPNRLSKKACDLIGVLQRKFSGQRIRYIYSDGHSGVVKSPVSGKHLSGGAWIQILKNNKIKQNVKHKWIEVEGGFIESTLVQFAASFRFAVAENPREMINLVLENQNLILEDYIDSLFSGIASSKKIEEVPLEDVESLFSRYVHVSDSERAKYVCWIVKARKSENWSARTLEILKEIIKCDSNICGLVMKPLDDTEEKSVWALHTLAVNSIKGSALETISSLLWEKEELFPVFKNVLEIASKSPDSIVRFASLYPLWPAYNIDQEWASEKILASYEFDLKTVGFPDSRNMLFRLRPKFRERVLHIIHSCFHSDEKELIEIGGYALVDMFIRHREFAEEINQIEEMSTIQADAIVYMLIVYAAKDEYCDIAKEFILKFRDRSYANRKTFCKLFSMNVLNLERDFDFLNVLLEGDEHGELLFSLIRYLEKSATPLLQYHETILSTCEMIINGINYQSEKMRRIEEKLPELIIGLYDETSSSKRAEVQKVAEKCLDIWDLMYEKQIGSIRNLSQQIYDR